MILFWFDALMGIGWKVIQAPVRFTIRYVRQRRPYNKKRKQRSPGKSGRIHRLKGEICQEVFFRPCGWKTHRYARYPIGGNTSSVAELDSNRRTGYPPRPGTCEHFKAMHPG